TRESCRSQCLVSELGERPQAEPFALRIHQVSLGNSVPGSRPRSEWNRRNKWKFLLFQLFQLFLSLVGGLHGGRHEHTPPTVQKWKDLVGGSCCFVGGSSRGLVRSFGNQKMVLNECVVADCIGPADPELDKCKRD